MRNRSNIGGRCVGSPALVDLAPQASSSLWGDRRGHSPFVGDVPIARLKAALGTLDVRPLGKLGWLRDGGPLEVRWGIEEYFRVLKTGTRIEDRRLLDADALVKCLAFDAVTAWRVFSLDRYARDEPETPAAEVLTGDEREVIGIVVRASGCYRRSSAVGSSRRTSGAGWCCWPASRTGSPRIGALCRATRSCGGLVCSCRRWSA